MVYVDINQVTRKISEKLWKLTQNFVFITIRRKDWSIKSNQKFSFLVLFNKHNIYSDLLQLYFLKSAEIMLKTEENDQ